MIKTIDINIQSETTLAIGTYLKRLQFKDLSPNTISKYTLCLRCYEKWLAGERISEDSAQTFLGFLKQKNLSQASVQAYYHAIKPFLKYVGTSLVAQAAVLPTSEAVTAAGLSAQAAGLIGFQVKFRKHHRQPHPHSPDQVKAILDIASNRSDRWKQLSQRDSLMILVFAHTGIRKGELMALRVRDINFYTNMISVIGKGDKERTIPMDPRIRKLLEIYIKNMQVSDRLFPLSSTRIGVIIRSYARLAGIADFSPHSFRHFFATQLVKSGVRIEVVQELLGHADLSTTRIYVSVVGEDMAEAITHLPNLMEE